MLYIVLKNVLHSPHRCTGSCVGIAIYTDTASRTKLCDVIPQVADIPTPVTCGYPSASVTVLVNPGAARPQPPPTVCDVMSYVIGDKHHCITGQMHSAETYPDAVCRCAALGGQLPELETLSQLADLGAQVTGGVQSWVGVYGSPAEGAGSYMWTRGEVVARDLWWGNEPHDIVGENCVVLIPGYTLFNVDCGGSRHFFCDVVN